MLLAFCMSLLQPQDPNLNPPALLTSSSAFSAGSRDSPLTSHGVLQARRLGTHLAGRATTIGPIKHIFASNLSRAVNTAEAIAEAQAAVDNGDECLTVVQRAELREKDFGSEEGTRFSKRPQQQQTGAAAIASSSAAYIAPESQDAMRARVERFVDGDLMLAVQHAGLEDGKATTAGGRAHGSIVVVAHGIILNVLLRCLLTRWGPDELSKLPGAGDASWRREWLAAWSNTGYLEAEVQVTTVPEAVTIVAQVLPDGTPSAPPLASASVVSTPVPADIKLSVKRVNCVDHLQGLKKTRGGIGSAGFDAKQKTMESFFSRPAKNPRKDDDIG